MEFIRDNLSNIHRIFTMAKLSVREEFRGTKLGVGWEFIRIVVFFTVYITFRLFIRGGGGKPVDAVLGIAAVILPFQFVTAVINQTPKIYRKRKMLVTTIDFPASIIPTYDIVAKLIIHGLAVAILLVVFTCFGRLNFNYLSLIYYYFALFMLLLAMMMTLSLVCSVSLDAFKLWQVVTKIFIYINPIFWTVDGVCKMVEKYNSTLGHIVRYVIRANPFVYIFDGFRKCMCDGAWIEVSWYALYFWAFTIGLFTLGTFFQRKVGKMLPDIL